jgi:hypothetical protein
VVKQAVQSNFSSPATQWGAHCARERVVFSTCTYIIAENDSLSPEHPAYVSGFWQNGCLACAPARARMGSMDAVQRAKRMGSSHTHATLWCVCHLRGCYHAFAGCLELAWRRHGHASRAHGRCHHLHHHHTRPVNSTACLQQLLGSAGRSALATS